MNRDREQIDQMISSLLTAIEGKPHYGRNLVGLAEVALGKKEKFRAFELARKALQEASGDFEVKIRAKALIGSLLPSYHPRMMNDARRNHAWDRALRRAIRPGMRVLEIGSGAGMLALMAARAGAEKVTTCEKDLIAATVAREICECNGYGSQVEVVGKKSQDLIPGVDLERPADLLFCDIFADTLLSFDPLPALADARNRLLAPGAPVIPAAGVIKTALGRWKRYAIACRTTRAAGFDISPFADLVRPSVTIEIGDPDLSLCSSEAEAFRFDFGLPFHPDAGRSEFSLEADCDGIVNGIVQWIRLELDSETALEAHPEPGAIFFSAPQFWPLPEPVEMRRGEAIGIVAEYSRKLLSIRRSSNN
jgi:type III protein arginine methyltransferase